MPSNRYPNSAVVRPSVPPLMDTMIISLSQRTRYGSKSDSDGSAASVASAASRPCSASDNSTSVDPAPAAASALGRIAAAAAGFGMSASVIRVKKSNSSCDRCVLAAATEACSFRLRAAPWEAWGALVAGAAATCAVSGSWI